MTAAMIGVTGARTAAMIGAIAAMTGATAATTVGTAVPDPGCSDSSMRVRTSKPTAPSPLSRTVQLHGSVTW
jgi:hypothetical protein